MISRIHTALIALIFLLNACSTKPGAMLMQTAEKTQDPLGNVLEDRLQGFHGQAGLYAHNFKTGETISIHGDTLFPTASMVKVPILMALFQKMENGALSYDSTLTWFPEVVDYPPGGILSSFKDSSSISLRELISLMITYSDNHASLWCQALAGGGAEINRWLEKNGFEYTRVNSRTEGRLPNWEVYGWGQTTPREMASALTRIHALQIVSPQASEEMYRYLTRIFWDDEALAEIPRTVQVASKQGAVDASRSEVVLVNAPTGDYVFCIITKDQEDQSWGADNEGFVLIRDVSQLLWSAWGS